MHNNVIVFETIALDRGEDFNELLLECEMIVSVVAGEFIPKAFCSKMLGAACNFITEVCDVDFMEAVGFPVYSFVQEKPS